MKTNRPKEHENFQSWPALGTKTKSAQERTEDLKMTAEIKEYRSTLGSLVVKGSGAGGTSD